MNNKIATCLEVCNLRLKAFHGWYDEERILGGMYKIHISLFKDQDMDIDFHSIDDTVNYEAIHSVVLDEMKNEHRLLESAVKAIFDRVKMLDSFI